MLLAPDDFYLVVYAHKNFTKIASLPNVEVSEFSTEDEFHRPLDSEFFSSYKDLSGNKVEIYTFNLSKSILVQFLSPARKFTHTIYSIQRNEGFYLHEVSKLITEISFKPPFLHL
ncbi:MAG: hypothetical protein HRU24_13220 [Gammaproteobacteria bacterium]|nr:hypothetical protein [Gammaproteobacteria bacterium]